ncbi:MAG: hypothetical protein QXX17_04470 [Conexivisphaerales archaeon]
MKYVKRYYAVLGRYGDVSFLDEARKLLYMLVGVENAASVQLSVIREADWGFIMSMRDYSGRNARVLPFVLSLIRGNDCYLQCFAISGTLKALSAKLKEMSIESATGMK